MGPGVDRGCGCRARMKVEPIFDGVRYKKRGQLVPPLSMSIVGDILINLTILKDDVMNLVVLPQDCGFVISLKGFPPGLCLSTAGSASGDVDLVKCAEHGSRWCGELQLSYRINGG